MDKNSQNNGTLNKIEQRMKQAKKKNSRRKIIGLVLICGVIYLATRK
jgi:cell division protein FtsB